MREANCSPVIYSPEMLTAFAAFKRVWDPTCILNRGILVDPDSLSDNLALEGIPDRHWRTSFDLMPSSPTAVDPFVHAVQGFVGIGRCRTDAGGVICPSFRATGDEKDSTRGRSRVLQDMVRGVSQRRGGMGFRGRSRGSRPVSVVQGVLERLPDWC